MDLNNLERGGLKNMQNHEADFNESKVWEKIQSKEKRRPFFWYWVSSVVAIGFISFVAFLFFNKNEKTQLSDAQKTDNQLITNHSIDKASKATETVSSELLSENAANSQNEEFKNKSFSPSKKSSPYISKIEKTKRPENTFSNSESISESNNSDFTSVESRSLKSNKESLGEKKSILNNIEFLPVLSANIEVEKTTKLNLPKVSKSRIAVQKNKGIIISAFGGIGYHNRNLSLKSDALNRSHINLRNANETNLESLAFGLDIDKRLSKKWLISTGVEMVYHNEKLNVEKVKISNLQDLPLDEIPSNLRGQNGFEIKRNFSEYFNQYRLINAPLRVGYIFNFKKIRIVPETGLVFNISHVAKGHIQSPKEQIVDLSKFYKTNVGYSFRAGCKFMVPLNNGFHIYSKNSFDLNPFNIANDLNPLIQKRNSIRMDLGVSRTF